MLIVLCLQHRNSTPRSLSKLSWRRVRQIGSCQSLIWHLAKGKGTYHPTTESTWTWVGPCCLVPAILALRKLRQEDCHLFEAILSQKKKRKSKLITVKQCHSIRETRDKVILGYIVLGWGWGVKKNTRAGSALAFHVCHSNTQLQRKPCRVLQSEHNLVVAQRLWNSAHNLIF